MEFGLREILILIGALVIGAIIFDGVRRMRQSRRSSLGMSMDIGGTVEDEYYGGELPGGGARISKGSKHVNNERLEPSMDGFSTSTVDDYNDPLFAIPDTQEESVMNGAVFDGTVFDGAVFDEENEPDISDFIDEYPIQTNQNANAPLVGRQQEMFTEQESVQQPNPYKARVAQPQPSRATQQPSRSTQPQSHRVQKESSAKQAPQRGQAHADKHREADSQGVMSDDGLEPVLQPKQVREVIIINVMAKKGAIISGNDLLKQAVTLGLRFGEMNIFHRHEKANGKGCLLFSMANVVEPGTFDLDHMDHFSTPGVCLFLSLPGPQKSMYAFDILIDIARKMSNSLNCEMRDEHHSVMTQQTIEHYRQRVLEFERRQLSCRPVSS